MKLTKLEKILLYIGKANCKMKIKKQTKNISHDRKVFFLIRDASIWKAKG
jgi:hypothetical protein